MIRETTTLDHPCNQNVHGRFHDGPPCDGVHCRRCGGTRIVVTEAGRNLLDFLSRHFDEILPRTKT
ncbi:MAG: hypothetical protein AB7G11_02370 [Phycisphaerales bacterium]